MGVFAPAVASRLPAPLEPFLGTLDAPVLRARVLVELTLWTGAGDVLLRLSDDGFASPGDDDPAHVWWDGRLMTFSWSRRTAGRRFGGRSDFRGGSLTLTAADRAVEIDGTTVSARALLRDYSSDKRWIKARLAPTRWADGVPLYEGYAGEIEGGQGGSVVVPLRGATYRLAEPLQPATYGGTGALDGGPELAGRTKPVALGRIYNAAPPLVDTLRLIYDLHTDRAGSGAPIEAVDAVRIGGVELPFARDFGTSAALSAATTGTPASGADIEEGEYATCLADGRIRLAATPGAPVTVDIRGARPGGTYTDEAVTLLRYAAQAYGPELPDTQIDAPAFSTLAQRAASIGRWIGAGEAMTVADLADEIADSLEASWGDTADGRLTVYAIAPPGRGIAANLGEGDILIDSIEWPRAPRDVAPAVKEVTVGFRRNWAPNDQLAASVAGEDREDLSNEWRTAKRDQVLARHPDAAVLRVDTLLVDIADAQAHADRLLAIYDGTVRRVRFRATRRAFAVRPGRTIAIDVPAEDVAVAVRVTGVELDATAGTVVIEGLVKDG